MLQPESEERSARRVKQLGREVGFDLVRIASASDMHVERARYLAWIEAGRHAGMSWITGERAQRATSPTTVFPEARAVISVGLGYWGGHRPRSSGMDGKIARYAWGLDYHTVMGNQLERFSAALHQEFEEHHRWYVDTGPTMDKAFAAQSGLGFYGKNTNVLSEELGSFVLLGEILTSLELTPDEPLGKDCGSCRLCVRACPTGALGPEYTIDSRRCISYLTIEHRGPIPRELRGPMDRWVFGCDICQDVCPPTMEKYLHSAGERRAWAREVRAQLSTGWAQGAELGDLATDPSAVNPLFVQNVRPHVDLIWLLSLTHDEYLDAFRGTAIRRAKVWMLRRNAAVALGNVGDQHCLPALLAALRTDEHPVVRGHAAWALGQIGARHCEPDLDHPLREALRREADVTVRDEIALARRSLVAACASSEKEGGQQRRDATASRSSSEPN